MLVSVIIPTFNRASFLTRSVKSVLDQTHSELELIIIDDGSTDNTKEIVNSINDDRISYYYIENSGVSSARNFGVSKANSDVVAFLDSDDMWYPNKLEAQLPLLDKFPLVHSAERWRRGDKVIKQKKHHAKTGADTFLLSLENCVISPSTTLMKKELFDRLAGFREDFIVCEDYDLWLKITSLFEVGFIEEVLIDKFGGHDDQLSMKYRAMDYYRVKSMHWILKNRNLSDSRLEHLITLGKKKCEILIAGYQKYEKLENIDEIREILEDFSLHN